MYPRPSSPIPQSDAAALTQLALTLHDVSRASKAYPANRPAAHKPFVPAATSAPRSSAAAPVLPVLPEPPRSLWAAIVAVLVGRRGRRRRAVAIVGAVLTLISGAGIVDVATEAYADTPASATTVASDLVNRTVAKGFGAANTGGSYTVNAPEANVAGGRATLSGIAPGGSASATLSSTSALDTDTRVSFVVPSRPTAGAGFDYGVALRHQPNGDSYHARVAVMPNGQLKIAFGRTRAGAQIVLGNEVTLAQPAIPGQVLNLEGVVSGTSPVTLAMRVWPAGAAAPAWQDTASDTSSARIASAGAVGTWAYLSAGATHSESVSMTGLTATSTSGVLTPTRPSQPTNPAKPATTPPAPAPSSAPGSASGPSPTIADPGPGITAGAPAIGSAAYAVPAGALYVSPSGSDGANGSLAAPVRTVAHAISIAKSGSTIVLRGGTYHESVTVPANKSLTIENYPHEAVWFDGSTPVSNFHATAGANTWTLDGWTAQFDSSPTFTAGSVPSGAYSTFVNPAYPMASHPDQVWFDGMPLTQVGSAAAVTAASFYVDYGSHRLVLGRNPAGHTVAASDVEIAITTYGPNDIVRGIGVRRYATSMDHGATVRLEGSGNVLENAVVNDNATSGITVNGTGDTVRAVTANNNGLLGLQAWHADGLTIDHVLVDQDNSQHFNASPAAGGIKIDQVRGVTVTNSIARDNYATGLWFDESSYDMTIENNTLINNSGHGLSVEISATGVVATNVIEHNGGIGIKVNNTSDLDVRNNTVGSNATDVDVVEDSRRGSQVGTAGHDHRRPDPDPTEPWIISNVRIENNVFLAPSSGNELNVRDASHQYTAAGLGIVVRGNRFTPGHIEIAWQLTTSTLATYSSAAAFAAATGTGQSNSDAP